MEMGSDLIPTHDMLVNVSVYAFAAFFTGSIISPKWRNAGVFSKKLSNALPYIFAQRL
jgi:hypothetical protein